MGKRNIAGTKADATLPKTPIKISGKTYDLCFDLGALAEAEFTINRDLARNGGELVNLLYALPVQNLANTRIVFAAAVQKFHPDLGFANAVAMVTLGNMWDIAETIREAWQASQPETEQDPPTAQTTD